MKNIPNNIFISWRKSWLLGMLVLFMFSCKEDENVEPAQNFSKINTFIWENMNEAYLWNDLIPQNTDYRNAADPKQLFENMLFKPTDRWSFITEDYAALINSFKGIEKTFGHHFKLFLLPGSNDVVGIVQYVVPTSPADKTGIKRGDKFYRVNGTKLNTSNYQDLLFDLDNYTLTFGEFDNEGKIAPVSEKALSAVVLAENPLLMRKTFQLEGHTIGYLSYNQFIQEYEDSLVTAFGRFRQEGITDLVLDLRYNPGGSINTAILLSSMIAPANVVNARQIFAKMLWNDKITSEIVQEEGEESENLLSRFVVPPVNLNLNTLYILVSRNTASASELMINCLRPYMDVVLVGEENTTGKFVGSVTIHDEEQALNWAMQPIVLKTANAAGVSDFVAGFAPDFFIQDDLNAELGTLQEDMFARAVELITGLSLNEPARSAREVMLDKMKALPKTDMPWKENMYLTLK
ncbi:MAG: peptidase S41 [Cyclobacteriaceae bacterium]|nr:peptidase S41 [Cyclobacteriaceae bacterium]